MTLYPSKLCLSIGNTPSEEICKLLETERFVELRVDLVPDFSNLEKFLGKKAAVIITCREGDNFSDERRFNLLTQAISLKCFAVDIEIESDSEIVLRLVTLAKNAGVKAIISYHNFEGTPETQKLEEIRERAFELGADLFKVACTVRSERESARLLSLLEDPREQVVVGMGEKGKFSRIAGPLLGGAFTFACLPGKETAPGQMTSAEIEELWHTLGYKF